MAYKLFFIFINIIILLNFVYSAPYDTNENIGYDIIKGQDNEFFCPNGSSLICCPLLAHRVATEYHSRCASIILINNSGYNLTLETVDLEDGRWITTDDYERIIDVNCEPHSILNGESEAISSVTSHFFGGIMGFVTFTMDDDISSQFVISWDVPTVGSPGYFFNFADLTSRNNYVIKTQKTFGDTVYRIEIQERIPWTWPIIPLSYIFIPLFIIFVAFFCCMVCTSIIEEQSSDPFRRRQRQSYVHVPINQQGRQSYSSIGQDNKQSYNFF